jgi:hypothetical protein
MTIHGYASDVLSVGWPYDTLGMIAILLCKGWNLLIIVRTSVQLLVRNA